MPRWSVLFFVFAICAGCLRAEAIMDGLDNSRVIQNGDVMGILILQGGVQPVEAKVDDNGELTPPFLKPMKAAGLTCRKLAYDIKRELEKNYFGAYPVLVKFTPASFRELMSVLDDRKVIQPGDRLHLRLVESSQAPDDQVVSKDGLIKIRHLGQVNTTGLTCKKLALQISQKLAALPADSLPFKFDEAPTVVVVFETIQPTSVPPNLVPPGLR